jgi:beta-N-acetylhexosaminidase
MIGRSAAILSCSGPVLLDEERRFFEAARPFGVILMGRSCRSPDQVRALTADIREAAGADVLIFIDQEGGRVARLKAPAWPLFPPAAVYGAIHARSRKEGLRAAWLGHRLMAAELAAIGIDADCAPVVDLLYPFAHDIIGDRAFGSDPEAVGELAAAALAGLSAGGVAGVIKHIPGHGRALADSHESLPIVSCEREALEPDLEAFRRVAHAPMAMTAHVAYSALDGACAATVSGRIIGEIIRDHIGFDGLLMGDDLGMKALGGGLADRARASLAAGCDVVLHCSGFVSDPAAIMAEMTAVAEAAPLLSGRSLERACAARAAAGTPEDADLPALKAEFFEHLSGLA